MVFTTTNLVMGVIIFAMFWCSVLKEIKLFGGEFFLKKKKFLNVSQERSANKCCPNQTFIIPLERSRNVNISNGHTFSI
jgi:hypothetical protein